jgi:hypothetical protein
MSTKPKITIVCASCGGSNVMRDAWAEWDDSKQEWVLGTVFDAGFCADCDGESRLEEKPLSPWREVTAARYDEMLGVVPPRTMTGCGFLVGEPMTHRTCTQCGEIRATYSAFMQAGGQYFEGPDLTFLEYLELDAEEIRRDAVRLVEGAACSTK